jgi:hypothetical protein
MSGSMLGLISLGPQGDAEAQERRAELVPATTGEVLGGAVVGGFVESLGPRRAREISQGFTDVGGGVYEPLTPEQATAEHGAFMPSLPGQLVAAFRRAFPGEQPLPASPMVPLETLKREYEIPGVLTFDKDTPQSVAQSLYDYKRGQMARADAVRRADNMLTQGMAARFAASMIGSLADPVNIAAMFIPGVNEAVVARMAGVAAGSGALARTGVRAGAGATQGAAGMVALEPLLYLQMQQDRDDWTMAGALANVLFGTIAGAGMHSGLGALMERSRGLPDWAPARLASERLQGAPPEVQQAIVRAAMADTVEGRPVDVANLFDLYTSLEAEGATLRGEIAALPARGLDEMTAARIDAVAAELDDAAITAQRRAALEAEMALLTEGQNPDIVALEQARTDAQRQGLEIAEARTAAQFAEIERQLEQATRPAREIMQDMADARAPDPRAAEPPAPPRPVDLPPPDPRPRSEPGALSRDIAEIEKQTAALDAQLAMRGDERMTNMAKEFDALVDEEVKVDRALFEAAAACIVRTR